MRLRSHRRNLVVWSQTADPAGRYGAERVARVTGTWRVRRWIRTGVLLAVIGLLPVARAVRVRWRPLLAGGALTAVGLALRGGPGSLLFFPGVLFLLYAPLIPADTAADRVRRSELERELAAYSTSAQRRELEATLDQYPDDITHELRDILAKHAMTTSSSGIPGGFRGGA